MKLQFTLGTALLVVASDIKVDRLSVEGALLTIDFDGISPENRADLLDYIVADIRAYDDQTDDETLRANIAALANAVAQKRGDVVVRTTYTDTHATDENPSSNEESHSLPTGDASTSNASQQSSSDTDEENTNGAQALEPEAGDTVAGNRNRRGRNRR